MICLMLIQQFWSTIVGSARYNLMKRPPQPKGSQLWRTVRSLFRPAETLESFVEECGDIFSLRAFDSSTSMVICTNPRHIQKIFAHPDQFDSSSGNEPLRFLLGDRSLILLDGDRHQRQRQLLTPPFHGERMRAYGRLICDVTQEIVDTWTLNQPIRVRDPMQKITLRVILKAVFGLEEGPRYETLRQLLTALLDSVSSPLSASLLFFPVLQKDLGSWSPWGRFLRLKQQVDRLLYTEIQERRTQDPSTRSDILSLLLSARDETGQGMTDQELRDELMTLLVAGHETTASALSWALYWIYTKPQVQEKLLAELASIDPTDVTAIAQLPYLNAVCQETLRIYPIAMFAFPRISKTPFQLDDYTFEPGTWLVPCMYLTHQREDLYPQPKQFKPERFLERQFSPSEYLPFGGSNRRCIGLAFAQFEMKLVLATIVSQWQLALHGRRSVQPQRRGLTLAPPANLQMVPVQPRSRAQTTPTVAQLS
jgi:cytochrome P450 family 110